MKEMDRVEVIAENEKYAKHGVHKGMQGWVVFDEDVDGYYLVDFPQYGEKDDIAMIAISEKDLRLLPGGMDVRINERIKAEFESKDK